LNADTAAEVLMNLLQGLYVSARNGRTTGQLQSLLDNGILAILK